MNARCASRRRRGRALAAVKDQRNDGQHGAVRKCRFHATIVAPPAIAGAGERQLAPIRWPPPWHDAKPRRGCVTSRVAARQIGKRHTIATAATFDQDNISSHIAHASHPAAFAIARATPVESVRCRGDLEIAHADRHHNCRSCQPSQSRSSRGSLMPEPPVELFWIFRLDRRLGLVPIERQPVPL